MENRDETFELELIYTIVNMGMGSKVLHVAKHSGIRGGTIFLGEGTVSNRILDFLSLSEVRKEIVLMLANRAAAEVAMDALDKELKLKKPNHGIAFTIPVCGVMGSKSYPCNIRSEKRGGNQPMYQAITVIVDRGKAEEVMDAAVLAGSKGGTIIHARGSGVHETTKLFTMDIEPEKEIVLILTKSDNAQVIASSIQEKLELEKPGNGILIIQDVSKTYGIYEE